MWAVRVCEDVFVVVAVDWSWGLKILVMPCVVMQRRVWESRVSVTVMLSPARRPPP